MANNKWAGAHQVYMTPISHDALRKNKGDIRLFLLAWATPQAKVELS